MKNISKLDFSGQQLYIGMDVHNKSWSISIFTEYCEHRTFSQPPKADVLVNYLKRNFPNAIYNAAYEAGFSGFWTHDQLKELGINCIVVNPADVPTKNKEKANKNDRIDCRKLARSLRAGELEGIYVPSREKIEDRQLTRTRKSMVKKQTRCKNQIKSILYFYGIFIPDDFAKGNWSNLFIKWLDEIRLQKASGNLSLSVHLEELRYIRQIIAKLNRSIRALAKTDEYRENVRLLQTIPGISVISAMTLLTELDDINRFKTLDELASYVGLIPNTNSSGEKEYKTNMTGRRNRQLRGLLIESAWVAARKDPALIMSFNQFCKRTTKNKAIVKIARKLLNRTRYVLKNRKPYVGSVIQ